MARVSAGGGPGVGPGGISREGGCESEVWDGLSRSLIRVLSSIMIVFCSGTGSIDGRAVGGMWVLFGFLT